MQQLVFLPDNAPFTEPQRAWLNGFVAGLLGMERTQSAPGAQAAAPAAAPQTEEDFPCHDPTLALDERMQLAAGRLISRTPRTAPGSAPELRHIALELDESGLLYEPGDSLGIWPHNNPDEVELLIAILRAKGSEAVTLPDGAVVAAREALGRECNLRMPSDSLYALLASEAKDEADRFRLSKLAEDDAQAEAL